MGKRILLFLVVNLSIVVTVSILLQLFGVGYYINPENGIEYQQLFWFCAAYGFVASFISLATSRWMAKTIMRVRMIDPRNPQTALDRDVLSTVNRIAQKAGLPKMPEVGIYESPEVNAFATGPSKSRALVAVSRGLLEKMDSSAVEGVLGHEVAHIANGDMVTMTLIQGVINTFVMFFARIAAWTASQALRGNDRDSRPSPLIHLVFVVLFEILFGLVGAVVVAFFSRKREFRADTGSAQLVGKQKMIHALRSLKPNLELIDESNQSVASLKISGKRGGFAHLFATHPDLDIRIAALEGR